MLKKAVGTSLTVLPGASRLSGVIVIAMAKVIVLPTPMGGLRGGLSLKRLIDHRTEAVHGMIVVRGMIVVVVGWEWVAEDVGGGARGEPLEWIGAFVWHLENVPEASGGRGRDFGGTHLVGVRWQ